MESKDLAAQESEEEEFTPQATQPVFVFGRTEYEQAILQILKSTPDQGTQARKRQNLVGKAFHMAAPDLRSNKKMGILDPR